jgi:hydrogenase maturation protein HypF
VVLSGGTFQNSFLTQKIVTNLYSKGYDVFLPREIPVNDQGIALGQLAIAAKQRTKLQTS